MACFARLCLSPVLSLVVSLRLLLVLSFVFSLVLSIVLLIIFSIAVVTLLEPLWRCPELRRIAPAIGPRRLPKRHAEEVQLI